MAQKIARTIPSCLISCRGLTLDMSSICSRVIKGSARRIAVLCALIVLPVSTVYAGACSGDKGCDSFGQSLASQYAYDDSAARASSFVRNEKTAQKWDLSALSARYSGSQSSNNTEQLGKKIALELQGFIAEHTSPIVVKALRGEHRGGVSDNVVGMGYKVKWSKDSLKLKIKYNF